jgi:hypothetical protein
VAFLTAVESPPSPKAQALIDAGELDSDEKVSMVGCSRETCKARVGTTGDVRCCFSQNCDSIAGHLDA